MNKLLVAKVAQEIQRRSLEANHSNAPPFVAKKRFVLEGDSCGDVLNSNVQSLMKIEKSFRC